ncbi:conserved hypothetical protein [Roseovarius sp. EC-HK134]|jgi:hypothetical protein|uniref:hypothetical protein n=1 Tax=Roseovarius TaxID=74030 RepID=UPI00015577EF|nr:MULTISPECIES: hypothetical protein [Roseovarius]AWZ22509.1 Hypothetical protein RAK1035_3804 [Roseovarius sp. AK1035]EDM32240.1 hypothetical protein RTM1035_12328 [Roseovarius sp. TM1035]MBW4972755.1 hypothetical protein [Roseovarius mucosus]VVT25173.1 conserved hypothetical protein [Roseovarius sp. EC-SD190]VVT33375.1 conserved hypothetical protein [Roseovarius sp. EC-HK134]
MTHIRHFADPAESKTAARARRARRWTWVAGVSLGVCGLLAIWQERALAPGVHDGMQRLVAQAQGVMDGNEAVRALLAGVDGGVDVAKDAGLAPLTALLLRATE